MGESCREIVPLMGQMNPTSERMAGLAAPHFDSESSGFNEVRSFLSHWHDECKVSWNKFSGDAIPLDMPCQRDLFPSYHVCLSTACRVRRFLPSRCIQIMNDLKFAFRQL